MAYWSFNDSYNPGHDDSGNGHDGVVHGGSSCDDKCDNPEKAYCFDGLNDYVEISSTSSLNPTVAITVEAWVYAQPDNRHSGIVEKGFAGSQYALRTNGDISPTGPKARFILGNEGYMMAQDSDELPVNQWVHVVGTFDGNYVKLYVNGQLKATTAWSGTISTSTYPLKIGKSDFANFNGTIDEVRIYDRALSACEIEHISNLACIETKPTTIYVDIKPQSCPNPLRVNFRGKGVLPVAILGSEDFNVFDIDIATITLEGVAPVRSSFEDVSTPFDGEECECSTEGADGFLDLVLKFRRADILDALEDTYGDLAAIPNREELPLTLTAMLIGEEVELEGTDCLRVLNRGRIKRKK